MTCRKFKKLLVPWLDGELNPQQAKAVSDWFSTCADARQCSLCKREIMAYQKLDSTLKAFPDTLLPSHVQYRILDRLKANPSIRHQQAIRHRWQAIPVAAAVLISLYFGSLVGIKTFNQEQTSSQNSVTTTETGDFGENSLIVAYEDWGGLK